MPINPYDDVALKLFKDSPEADPAAVAAANVVKNEKAQVEHSMFIGAKQDPNRAAEVQKLAREVGLPADVVDRNLDTVKFERKSQGPDYDKLVRETPALARWLKDPNNAAIAHDDIENLQSIERTVNDWTMGQKMAATINTGLANLKKMAADTPALAFSGVTYFGNKMADVLDMPEAKVKTPDFLLNLSSGFKDEIEQNQFPDLSADFVERAANGDWSGASRAFTYQVLSNAPQQMAIIAASMYGAGIPALVTAGVGSAASANVEGLKEGAEPGQSLLNAIYQGLFEAGTESIGTFGIFKHWENLIATKHGKEFSLKIMSDFAKTVFAASGGEFNEEFINSFAQDYSAWATGVDPQQLDFMSMLSKALSSGALGAGSGFSTTGPAAFASGIARGNEMRRQNGTLRQAISAKDLLIQLRDRAMETVLKERAPEANRSLVDETVKGTAAENVYISAEAVETYFQGQGIPPGEAMQKLGVLKEYEQAKETGSPIKIPTGAIIEKLGDSEHFSALADDIKFDPEALSVNEAKAEAEQIKQDIAAQDEAAKTTPVEEKPVDQTQEQKVQEVVSQIGAQLKAAGLDPTQAELQARPIAIMAMQEGLDPVEFLKELNLRISRGEMQQPINVGPEFTPEGAPIPAPEQPAGMFKRLAQSLGLIKGAGPATVPEDTTLDQDSTGAGDSAIGDQNGQQQGPGTEAGRSALGGQVPEGSTRLEGLPASSPGPVAGIRDLARRYADDAGLDYQPQRAYVKADPERGARIAQAFEEMKHDPENPEVLTAYRAMISETLAQYQYIKETGLKIDVITADMPNPYPNSAAMMADVARGHLWFFPTDLGFGTVEMTGSNPLTEPSGEMLGDRPLLNNDIFRIVHDYFGHAKEGNGFGPDGEENAWQAHARMYSPLAARAMTSETRGQNSWVNFGPLGEANRANPAATTYADQKIGLLPDWVMSEGFERTYDQATQTPLGFVSGVELALEKMDFKTSPARDLKNRIVNLPGIKKEELETLGLNEFLDLKGSEKVTKEEVIDFVRANGVQVDQIVLSADYNLAKKPLKKSRKGKVHIDELDFSGDYTEPSEDQYENAARYYLDDSDMFYEDRQEIEERLVSELREELTSDFTNEEGEVDQEALDKAVEEETKRPSWQRLLESTQNDELYDRAYEIAVQSVNDNHDEFEIIENETGFSIRYSGNNGNGEILGPDGYVGGIPYREIPDDEAQGQTWLSNWLVENGHVATTRTIPLNEIEWVPTRDPLRTSLAADDMDDDVEIIKDDDEFQLSINSSYHDLGATTLDDAKTEAIAFLQKEGIVEMPEEPVAPNETPQINPPVGKSRFHNKDFQVPGGTNYREVLMTLPKNKGGDYVYNMHWSDRKNIIAHLRLTDRIDPDGNKILVIEEMQSDWQQRAREYGYIKKRTAEEDAAIEAEKARLNAIIEENQDIDSDEDGALQDQENEEYRKAKALVDPLLKNDFHLMKNQRMDIALSEVLVEGRSSDEAYEEFVRPEAISLDDFAELTKREDIQQIYKRRAEIAKTLEELSETDRVKNEARRKLIDEAKEALEAFEAEDESVPDAPFKSTEAWAALAMKRALRMAVEEGYAGVALAPAEVHVERWGSDTVSWVKKSGEGFEILDEDGKVYKRFGPLTTKDDVEAELAKLRDSGEEFQALDKKYNEILDGYRAQGRDRAGVKAMERMAVAEEKLTQQEVDRYTELHDLQMEHDVSKFTVAKPEPHWLVGSVEQVGGRANGMNIEEAARQRGELLERNGERVTSKEELHKIIKSTLHRERGQRSLESLTETVWKQMQSEASGLKAPRKEGMEFFYNNVLPRKVIPDVLKKLDKGAKLKVSEFKIGETSEARYIGPELTIEQVEARIKELEGDQNPGDEVARLGLIDLVRAMREYPETPFAEHASMLGPRASEAIGGRIKDTSIPETMKMLQVDITPAMREAIMAGQTLFQREGEEPRGQIHIGSTSIAMDILKNANASTVFHEMGHLHLEIMGRLAARPEASDKIKNDFKVLLDWFGVDSASQIKKKHHEQFARGFEKYIGEGVAPTKALQEAFDRFKLWIISVYKNLQNLNVELTDDVRDVFGRMMAGDAAVSRATTEMNHAPLFGDPAAMGMDEVTALRYRKAQSEAQDAAKSVITAKLMQERNRKLATKYAAERDKVLIEVKEIVHRSPLFSAISILQNGTMPDGSPMPEGSVPFKIDPKTVDVEERKLFPRGIWEKDGVHPDMAAKLLGFASGNQLMDAIRDAPKQKEYIEQRADEVMAERYPELMKDDPALLAEAVDAVHNDSRAKVLRMELEHLASNNMPVLKDAIRRVVRRVPTQAAVREQAENFVSSQAVGELKPYLYARNEVKAAREAGEMLTQGNIDGAFKAKRRELLNHELFRAATRAKQDVEKSVKRFKRLFKPDDKTSKTRDMDIVNAARAVLQPSGILPTRVEKSTAEYLKRLSEYDPDTYNTVQALVENASQASGPYEEMAYGDFRAMTDAVSALWDLSKSSKQLTIDGKKMDFEQVIGELKSKIAEYADPSKTKPGMLKSVSDREKRMVLLLGAKAAATRTEHWADAMDVEKNGPFRRYIVNPILKATTRYRLEKEKVMKRYLENLDKYRAHLKATNKGEINAPELNFIFGDKSQLIMALLHSGNESNLSKLLRGRPWGSIDENGDLNTSNWDAFIDRMRKEGVLTKEDYDFAQSQWDLMESIKGDAQRAHKAMYGTYFNEITAKEIVTPWGVYRGGYIPAKVDSYTNEDTKIRQQREAFEKNNNSFQFPTTGRGFTKARVPDYAAPLNLNMSLLAGHIDAVMRFTHIEPAVKEVARVVNDKGLREALQVAAPEIASEMLVPWLQRAAQQRVVLPSDSGIGKLIDAGARFLRANAAMQIMAGSVVNTLEQFTGLAIAASKVKPSYLLRSMATYTNNPKQTVSSMLVKSDFMRSTQGSNLYETRQRIEEIIVNPTTFQKWQIFSAKHVYFLQSATQNIVNTVTWVAAYDQAIANGVQEEQAVLDADSAVRTTQGSNNPEDVSRFETGTAGTRLFTQFASYFNMLGNLQQAEVQKVMKEVGLRKGAERLFFIYVATLMIPAVLSGALRKAFSGEELDEDDDGYLDDSLAVFFGSQASVAAALVPGFGQVLNTAFNRFNKKPYDDRLSLSPVFGTVESMAGVPAAIVKAMNGESSPASQKRAVKDTLMLIGMCTSLPIGPLGKPIGYLMDYGSGEANPDLDTAAGYADFARGLVTGRKGSQ